MSKKRSSQRKRSSAAKKTPAKASPPVTQWIGQLAEDPSVWFVAWAPTRTAARNMVTRDIGAVARGSLREIRGSGYFLFRAAARRTPGMPLTELLPSEGEYLILYDPPTEAWILRKVAGSAATANASQAPVEPRQ